MISRNERKAIKEIVLKAGRMVAQARENLEFSVEFKADGTPVTDIDRKVQRFIAKELKSVSLYPVIGEEEPCDKGCPTCWAVDPIDGTWAFLNHENTAVINLSLIVEGEVRAGLVYNPFTREFFSSFGGGAVVNDHALPLIRNNGITVVHFSPNLKHRLEGQLFKQMRKGSIKKLTALGGSHTYAMCMVAKGSFSNCIFFFQRAAEPWDVSAAWYILCQAGGVVTDLFGKSVDPLSHQGFFVASGNPLNHERFLSLLAHRNL